ncbi:MAG: hypothetical protein ACXABY_12510 [Candidatus Thorarchaeota archaeon]|jgi:hypothetical protein
MIRVNSEERSWIYINPDHIISIDQRGPSRCEIVSTVGTTMVRHNADEVYEMILTARSTPND